MVDTTGIRFLLMDDELVGYYLQKKITGMTSLVEEVITEINIYNFDPWDLRFQSKLKPRNPVWYFFVAKGNNCGNGDGESRRTSSGFWKITGKAVDIKDRWGFWSGNQGQQIGYKKCLVFHKDKNFNMGKKEWVMHEYHSRILPENQRTHVICRVEYMGDDITFLPHDAIIPSSAFLHYITGRGERKEAQEEEGTKRRSE